MLLTCRSMAQVAIVTLAERPWVLDSADHFLPGLNLKRLLRDLDIPVYYAVEYRKPSRTPLLPAGAPKTIALEPKSLRALRKRLRRPRSAWPWKISSAAYNSSLVPGGARLS